MTKGYPKGWPKIPKNAKNALGKVKLVSVLFDVS